MEKNNRLFQCVRCLFVFFFLSLTMTVILPHPVFGEEPVETEPGDVAEKQASDLKWFATGYWGIFTPKDLSESWMDLYTEPNGRGFFGVSIGKELYHWTKHLTIEFEGFIGQHYFEDDGQTRMFGELAAVFLLRYRGFPWDEYVRTTAAFGEGVSQYTMTPPSDDEYETARLNYLAWELTFGLPDVPQFDLVYRIHHRSSFREKLGNGSNNYYSFGLRYFF